MLKDLIQKYAKGLLAAVIAAASAYLADADVVQTLLSAIFGGGIVASVPNKTSRR